MGDVPSFVRRIESFDEVIGFDELPRRGNGRGSFEVGYRFFVDLGDASERTFKMINSKLEKIDGLPKVQGIILNSGGFVVRYIPEGGERLNIGFIPKYI